METGGRRQAREMSLQDDLFAAQDTPKALIRVSVREGISGEPMQREQPEASPSGMFVDRTTIAWVAAYQCYLRLGGPSNADPS